jgi:hypothetical protein
MSELISQASVPEPTKVTEDEKAELVREASSQVAHFLTETKDPEGAAEEAEEALHEADDAGVDRDELADGLEVTPHVLDVILDGDVDLIELHPTRTDPEAYEQ